MGRNVFDINLLIPAHAPSLLVEQRLVSVHGTIRLWNLAHDDRQGLKQMRGKMQNCETIELWVTYLHKTTTLRAYRMSTVAYR